MAKGSKLLGGTTLADIARGVKPESNPDAPAPAPLPQRVPAAEFALNQGRPTATAMREAVYMVDPKRCRPWKFHNRDASWYTRENCQDLIESIPKDGQAEPALARDLKGSDPNFDYELIYGMRRRYACEVTGQKLKLKVLDLSDADAAVRMHIENADRKDITAMERALSFAEQLDAKLFATQDQLAEAVKLSKGQVTKMLKAASILRIKGIAALLPNRTQVPVKSAYELANVLDRPGAKEVILKKAENLAQKDKVGTPSAVLKALIESINRTQKVDAKTLAYNVGSAARMQAVRNPKGKVTLSFAAGFTGVGKAEVLAAVEKAFDELA